MSEYILDVTDVDKNFGGLRALSDINLRVKEGTVHAIIGPNGAGKSTLLNVIVGRLAPNHNIKGRLVLTRYNLGDRRKAMFAVARIDPFRRIANRKISARFQPGNLFKDRHAFFFGRTGINRAFIDNDVALFKNGANGF